MYYFSKYSENNLLTCVEPLQCIARAAIQAVDFKVICGIRGKEAQDAAFASGASRKEYPNSNHNKEPSLAMDIVPWHRTRPHIRWEDTDAFIYLAGHVLMAAEMLGIGIRWGRDWNVNDDLKDETYFDYAHFEITS